MKQLPTITAAARAVRAGVAGMSTYRWLQLAVLVILAVAFVTSFESGAQGARMLGYPTEYMRAFPLVVDVVAAVATIAHGRAPTDGLRRLAAGFVLVPMTLSWGANALDHWTRARTTLPDGWPVEGWAVAVVLAAGVCPVAVAALLYFMGRYADAEPAAGTLAPSGSADAWGVDARTRVDVVPAPEPARPAAAPRTNGASRPVPSADVDTAARWAADEIRAGRDAGRDSISREHGLSAWKARQAAARAKELASEPAVPVGES